MAEMQIAMRLTLADFATGPLAEFMAKLQGLQVIADKVNASFSGVSRKTAALGDVASTATDGLFKLQTQMAALSEKLNGAAEAFTGLRTQAVSATDAVAAGAAKMDAASASVQELTGHVGGLSTALRGMAELWAGLKIEHGLRKSFEAAKDMQTQMATLMGAGLSRNEAVYARNWSERTAQRFPWASSNDIMEGRRAFVQATGLNNERVINAALPRLLQNAIGVQQVTGGKLSDIIANMAGIAETRGMTTSAAAFIKASDLATRIVEASQGRMTLQRQEMVLRQTKYGGAAMMSDTGMANLMALAEQFVVAGHGGGSGGSRGVSQAGTALSMVLKTMLGGKMNKVTYELLQRMGMLEQGGVVGSTATTSLNALTKIKGTAEGERDPIGWLMRTLAPAMLAYVQAHPGMYFPGGKVGGGENLQVALDRLAVQLFGPTGGVNVGNLAFLAANPATAGRINAQRERVFASAAGSQVTALYGGTAAGQLQAFKAQLQTLETTIGQTFLPMLTGVLRVINGLVGAVNRLASQFPALTGLIAKAAAALSVFLTIRGFARMLGMVGNIGRAIMAMGAASTAAKAEGEAAAGGLLSRWGIAARGIAGDALRLGAVFAVVFSLGYAVRNVQVGGLAIQHSLERVMLAIAGGFDRLFTGLLAKSAAVSQSMLASVARLDHAVGLNSLGDWFSEKASAYGAMRSSLLAGFKQRDNARAAMFAYEGTAAAQHNDYMQQALQSLGIVSTGSGLRAPHGAPDTEQQALNALFNGASGVDLQPGTSSAHGTRRSRGGGRSASSWFDRAFGAATRNLNTSFAPYRQALAAIARPEANTPQAIRARYAGYAKTLAAFGDHAAAARATSEGDRLANQAGYKQAMATLQKLKDQLAAEEQLIAARVQVGSITKQQGAQQDIAVQKQIAPAMEKAAEAAKGYANALKDPALSASIEAQLEKIKAMGSQLNDLQKGITNTAQSSTQTFLEQLMRGNLTWRNMFAQLNNNLLGGINKNVAQSLSQSITGKGQNSGLGSWFLSLFGGGAGSSGAASAASSGGFWSSIGSWLSSFAVGTDYVPHDMVAQIHQGEMIIPAAPAQAIRGGGLGGNTVNLNIHAMDGQSVLGAMEGVKRELALMLGSASAGYNLG